VNYAKTTRPEAKFQGKEERTRLGLDKKGKGKLVGGKEKGDGKGFRTGRNPERR